MSPKKSTRPASRVLSAVIEGYSTSTEVGKRTDMRPRVASIYLGILADLGLIQKTGETRQEGRGPKSFVYVIH